jgi:hypothetical protein
VKRLVFDERFWSKVDKSDRDSCWVWSGSRDAYGYGMFRVQSGKTRRAHRIAWELTNGPVPDGTVFLHHCDNPPCVNPAHLRIGTRAENNADRDAKGRGVYGGRAGIGSKIDASQARQIRAWCSYGFTQKTVGLWFGIADSTVCNIVSGKLWATA